VPTASRRNKNDGYWAGREQAMKLIAAISGIVIAMLWQGVTSAATVTPEFQHSVLTLKQCQAGPTRLGPQTSLVQAVGTVTNHGETHGAWNLLVHVYVYDEDHVRVGQAADATTGLRPGETWRFNAPTLVPGSGLYSCEAVLDLSPSD
jgi:hypothetical protein